MKALVYHGPGTKSWEDVPDARSQEPTDVVVRVDTTTICGTDLHILQGDVAAVTDGRILGHEAVGTVTAVGDAVKGFAVGDRVLVPAITKCGRCEYCQRGMPVALPDRRRHRLDLRPPHRRHPGRVRARAVRRHLALPGARLGHQRAGDLPGRLAAHRLRGRRARGRGPARRHRRRRRSRRGGPLRDPHHRPVGRVEGDRRRLQQVPAGEGARVRRDRRGRGRAGHRRRRHRADRRARRRRLDRGGRLPGDAADGGVAGPPRRHDRQHRRRTARRSSCRCRTCGSRTSR